MGKRALRLCLDEPELFSTQLRAALRASAFGPFQIMFLMVGGIDDMRSAKADVEAAKGQLREKNQAFDEEIKFGIMIEILVDEFLLYRVKLMRHRAFQPLNSQDIASATLYR